MPPRRADKGPVQRPHFLFAVGVGFALQLLHCLTNLKSARRGLHGATITDRDPIGYLPRQLPEKPSPLETEDASPDAIEAHRNDGRLDPFYDSLQPPAKRQELSNTRDLPFGEDADNMARPDRLAGASQRPDHLARPLLRRDRNRVRDARKRMDQRMLVVVFEHQEADAAVR